MDGAIEIDGEAMAGPVICSVVAVKRKSLPSELAI
jgi:hypothetical protein